MKLQKITLLIGIFLHFFSCQSAESAQKTEVSIYQNLPPASENIKTSLKNVFEKTFMQRHMKTIANGTEPHEKEDFTRLLFMVFKTNFKYLEPSQKAACAHLLTFLISTYQEIAYEISQAGPESVLIRECDCISPSERIIHAFLTILESAQLFKDKIANGEEKLFIYTSLASGYLLPDYLILAGLLKIGILPIVANFIDPIFYPLQHSLDTYKKTLSIFTKKQSEHEEGKRYTQDEITQLKEMAIIIDTEKIDTLFNYYRNKLSNTLNGSGNITLFYWHDLEDYLKNSYLAGSDSEIRPDLLVLIDPEWEIYSEHYLIWENFLSLLEQNHNTYILSCLYHPAEENKITNSIVQKVISPNQEILKAIKKQITAYFCTLPKGASTEAERIFSIHKQQIADELFRALTQKEIDAT